MMLQLAGVPGILMQTWAPMKSKQNEGVLMIPGNKIGSLHRARPSIPLPRRMKLSTWSRLANLVRIMSREFHVLCSLTSWVLCRSQATATTTTEEFVQGIHYLPWS